MSKPVACMLSRSDAKSTYRRSYGVRHAGTTVFDRQQVPQRGRSDLHAFASLQIRYSTNMADLTQSSLIVAHTTPPR